MHKRGHDLQAIANATGIGRTTLRGYLADSQPPHWRGERLIALWMQTCGRSREEVPITTLPMSVKATRRRSSPRMSSAAAVELDRVLRGGDFEHARRP